MSAAETPTARRVRLLTTVIAGVLVVMLGAWVLDDPRENLATDWTAFDIAAERLFEGDRIYRDYAEDPLPYLYPPPALWLAAPLRLVGFYGSWALSALLALATTVASVLALTRRAPTQNRQAAISVALTSGLVISSTLIGQYSGLWLAGLAFGLVLWRSDRDEAAGVAFALLLLKPNIGIIVLGALLWARAFRVLAGTAGAALAMAASSLVFGPGLWGDFGRSLEVVAEAQVEFPNLYRKMITIPATLHQLVGLDPSSGVGLVVWFGIAGFLGLALLTMWSAEAIEESKGRAVAALVLYIVAASPRLYFYDGVVLLLPGLVWWASSGRWFHREATERRTRLLMAALWCSGWGGLFAGLNVLVGPITGVLLLLWAQETRQKGVQVAYEREAVSGRISVL